MINGKLLQDFIIVLPILLVSLAFHELAHGAVAAALGDPTARLNGRLTLNPIRHLDLFGSGMLVLTFLISQGSYVFGWAKPIPVDPRRMRHPQRDMMLVGAAGPLTNLLMAAVMAGLLHISGDNLSLATRVLRLAFTINIVLALINLIPIPPLDGYRIIGGLMPPQLYSRWLALDRYAIYALLAFVLLIRLGSGVFSNVVDATIRGMASVLLPGWAI